MTARALNGASVHAERPDAEQCWSTALEQRSVEVEREIRSCELQVAGADKLRETRRDLVRVAEALMESEAAAVERAAARLREYAAESEQLLAGTGGRVKSLRARIEHLRNQPGVPAPDDVLQAALRTAELEDGRVLGIRTAGTEKLRLAWMAAARAALGTGLQFLALVEPDADRLEAARPRLAQLREELAEIGRLALRASAGRRP